MIESAEMVIGQIVGIIKKRSYSDICGHPNYADDPKIEDYASAAKRITKALQARKWPVEGLDAGKLQALANTADTAQWVVDKFPPVSTPYGAFVGVDETALALRDGFDNDTATDRKLSDIGLAKDAASYQTAAMVILKHFAVMGFGAYTTGRFKELFERIQKTREAGDDKTVGDLWAAIDDLF